MTSQPWEGRPILSVVGPHSGCGKTSFVLHLLHHMSGLGCLKVRPAHGRVEEDAISRQTSGRDFYLESQQDLNRPGEDTGLYLAAGAAQVEILRHRGEGLAAGLRVALERFPTSTPIVVESSSAVRLVHPVAVVLIVRPPMREMKPSTETILPRITDLLINASNREGVANAAAERLGQQFPSLRPRFSWSADLTSEPPPEPMLQRLQALLQVDLGGIKE